MVKTKPAPDPKDRTTLYLPLSVQERFADLRRALRRNGVSAHDASNSSIVVAIVRNIAEADVLKIFARKQR